MSGRSAYVRKEKTKVKDGGTSIHAVASDGGSIPEFPIAMTTGPSMHFQHALPMRQHTGDLATIKSGSTNSDEQRGYARVQKPIVPIIVDSGIEKSAFRSVMDKKSEGIRKGLAKTFGKKKKEEDRPSTSTTIRAADQYELDAGNYNDPSIYTQPPTYTKPRTMHSASSGYAESEYSRPPPQGKLPPIPQGPQMKRWVGGNRPVQPWNKLRKDPELWDPNGDTLIIFGRNDPYGVKPAPSFRISSHIIERTESRKLMILLRQGSTDEQGFGVPPSPMSSPDMAPAYPSRRQRTYHQTPPISENSSRGMEGQISYELYFEPEKDKSPAEIIRHQVTTRNFFALLCDKSLAGLNLFQTLNDLTERLEEWMPHDTDAAGMVIDYMVGKGFDDLRDNPSAAASILAWSELQNVWWEEGWIEGFIHCCGMYNRIEACPDFRFVSSITRAHLERSALDMQIRVHDAETRLGEFDFIDMWPLLTPQPPPARASFDKARKFFLDFYRRTEGGWPPLPPPADDQWLTRTWAQKLQTDFGALYDYLVDRAVLWDGSEERSGRKWNIVNPGHKGFDADSPDLPFTDILVAFDNRHSFPHIPRPYCLVPDPAPKEKSSGDSLFKSSKKAPKSMPDKMAETKARLAYTNSTNVFALGTSFPRNELVEEFTKFEKSDFTVNDPHPARRGHWVLIYGILQVLASVSVDSPNMRYWDGMPYHMSPKLRDTPPWRKGNQPPEAGHTLSHCWLAVNKWSPKPSYAQLDKKTPSQQASTTRTLLPTLQTQALMMQSNTRSPSSADSSGEGSYKKLSTFPSTKPKQQRSRTASTRDSDKNEDINNTSFFSQSTGSTRGGIPSSSVSNNNHTREYQSPTILSPTSAPGSNYNSNRPSRQTSPQNEFPIRSPPTTSHSQTSTPQYSPDPYDRPLLDRDSPPYLPRNPARTDRSDTHSPHSPEYTAATNAFTAAAYGTTRQQSQQQSQTQPQYANARPRTTPTEVPTSKYSSSPSYTSARYTSRKHQLPQGAPGGLDGTDDIDEDDDSAFDDLAEDVGGDPDAGLSHTGYAPGIEKVESPRADGKAGNSGWPMRNESRRGPQSGSQSGSQSRERDTGSRERGSRERAGGRSNGGSNAGSRETSNGGENGAGGVGGDRTKMRRDLELSRKASGKFVIKDFDFE